MYVNKAVKVLNKYAYELSLSDEAQMEEFEGSRAGTKVYMCPNKYLYRIDRGAHGDQVLYYKCSLKRCSARAISYHGVLSYRSKHCHGPQLAQAEAHRFRAELRRRASKETGHLETIYMQTQVLYREGAVQDGCGFEQVRLSMLRARNMGRPPPPESLIAAAISIQDPKYMEEYAFSLGPGKRNLYHGMVTTADGKRSMILKSADILDFILMQNQEENSLHLYVESSYAITTATSGCKHFITINLEYRDYGFPVVFALMEARGVDVYVSVLTELKTILGDIDYTSISVVHDDDLKNAIKTVFPTVKLSNSWFHYSAAIYKQADLQFLLDSENREIRQLVRMTMCLPLLPNELHIKNGWILLWNQFNQHVKGVDNNPFTLYMDYHWLANDIFEFNRLAPYTDNSFKNLLMRVLGKERTSFWSLYRNIQLLEHSYGLKLIRLFNNRDVETSRNKGVVEFLKHLELALDVLSVDPNIEQFLKQMASKLNSVTWLIKKYSDIGTHASADIISDSDGDAICEENTTDMKMSRKKVRRKGKINKRATVAAYAMDHNYMKQSVE